MAKKTFFSAVWKSCSRFFVCIRSLAIDKLIHVYRILYNLRSLQIRLAKAKDDLLMYIYWIIIGNINITQFEVLSMFCQEKSGEKRFDYDSTILCQTGGFGVRDVI